MRTKNLFRAIAATCLAAAFSVSANAQFLTSTTAESEVETTANEVTEFVTVGSIMPYSVTPTADVTALEALGTVDQIWAWTVAPARAITQQDGSPVTAALAPDAATHIQESAIAITWAATGAHTISVVEKSQFLLDDAMSCSGATEDLAVEVVAEPTVVWNNGGSLRLGGCGVAGTPIGIPVTVTGTDLFRLTYTQTYVDLTGTPTVTGPVTTADLGTSDIFTDFTNSENIDMYTLNIPAATYGRYEITISAVTDRISRKSLNNYVTETATYGSQDPGDFVTTTMIVYSLPTPTTGQIQHVTNLGW